MHAQNGAPRRDRKWSHSNSSLRNPSRERRRNEARRLAAVPGSDPPPAGGREAVGTAGRAESALNMDAGKAGPHRILLASRRPPAGRRWSSCSIFRRTRRSSPRSSTRMRALECSTSRASRRRPRDHSPSVTRTGGSDSVVAGTARGRALAHDDSLTLPDGSRVPVPLAPPSPRARHFLATPSGAAPGPIVIAIVPR